MSKRLSDLVDEINKKIEMTGDLLIQHYTISDEFETDKWSLLSKDRIDKSGRKCKMNLKEFREYVKELNLEEN